VSIQEENLSLYSHINQVKISNNLILMDANVKIDKDLTFDLRG